MRNSRLVAIGLGSIALCLAQGGWQTATVLPAVDFTGMSAPTKHAALEVLRSESCNCGCGNKLAECRVNDSACGVSRRLAQFVVREASAGKSATSIREALIKYENTPPPLVDEQATKLQTVGDPVRGNAGAKITIVEFSDFQCPFCAEAAGEVKQLLARYPDQVKLVFKQFPLDSHAMAETAAEAALAAQEQGKFWEMHDKLYANFRSLSIGRILVWAKEIGLDVPRFKADLDSHKYAARVASEEKQGEVAGVEGTPTFFIDGHRLNAAFDVQTVAPLIARK
ncbi:MAG TPA: thioredoxin domain-containing protein [Bryobacteraceae bacterium]|nr:thioredoxin domain-containing protein [Bryobacteraceae bacterium]